MLLCIDVGNTNIVLCMYRGDELVTHWRVSTDSQKMPDEYGVLLLELLATRQMTVGQIDGVILASVVPPVTDLVTEMLQAYVGREPLIVGAGIKTGVAVRYDSPRDVGADRIVDAAAAYKLYGGPACIVDFGTATTFNALAANGDYLGGAIAPGVRVAAEALFQRTAKLPRIDLRRPKHAIGSNTVEAMHSGILWGYVGLVEGMVARFRKELGDDMRVIGTGGLSGLIAEETDVFDVVDPWLTLKGLKIIWDLNRGPERGDA